MIMLWTSCYCVYCIIATACHSWVVWVVPTTASPHSAPLYHGHQTNITISTLHCASLCWHHTHISVLCCWIVSVLLATIPCDPVYSPPKPFSIQCLLSLPSQQSDNTEILSENTNTTQYDMHSTLHALENTFNNYRIACKELGVRFLINEGNIYIHSKVQYLHCDTGGNDVLHDDWMFRNISII